MCQRKAYFGGVNAENEEEDSDHYDDSELDEALGNDTISEDEDEIIKVVGHESGDLESLVQDGRVPDRTTSEEYYERHRRRII